MGNSCLTGASAEQRQTTFKWTIDGFSSLLNKGEGWTHSGAFEIMGLTWCLILNPRDKKSGDENEYVSLRLMLAKSSVKPNTVVEACFKFLIYDQYYGNHLEHQVSHNFETASTSAGIACMVPLSALKTLSSGFIVDDSCVFCVEFIKVATAKANMLLETHSVPKMNSLNEAKTYTWNSEDFFVMEIYYRQFKVGGHTCYIGTFPSCNGKDLIVWLVWGRMPNGIRKDSANLVINYTLSIKNQEGGKYWEGKGQFSSKDAYWFNDFLLENFKDARNGYRARSKFYIEAKITIVASSKTEDAESADSNDA